jgi:hypothetical protein
MLIHTVEGPTEHRDAHQRPGRASIRGHALLGPSLNYLIRPRQYGWRDRHAEDLGGLEVDHELERSGLLDWKVPRIRALEDAIDIRRGATVHR